MGIIPSQIPDFPDDHHLSPRIDYGKRSDEIEMSSLIAGDTELGGSPFKNQVVYLTNLKCFDPVDDGAGQDMFPWWPNKLTFQ